MQVKDLLFSARQNGGLKDTDILCIFKKPSPQMVMKEMETGGLSHLVQSVHKSGCTIYRIREEIAQQIQMQLANTSKEDTLEGIKEIHGMADEVQSEHMDSACAEKPKNKTRTLTFQKVYDDLSDIESDWDESEDDEDDED